MDEVMTFPNTWEEFEQQYGFTDTEHIYTNGSRLIHSFRVKQWLDHMPSAKPERHLCRDCKYAKYHADVDKYGNVESCWYCINWYGGTDEEGFCYEWEGR